MRFRPAIAIVIATLLLNLISGCSDSESGGGGPKDRDAPAADTPAKWQLIACAYVDTNGNGEIDTADTRLPGAQLQVDLAGGAGFGGVADVDGCAFASLPGTPGDANGVYPITMRMLPPEGSNYILAGSEAVTLVYPETAAAFLFVAGE